MYPDRCSISIGAVSDLDLYNKHVTYWDDVYGFKMTCMKTCVIREASVEIVSKDIVVTDSCVVKVVKLFHYDYFPRQKCDKFTFTNQRHQTSAKIMLADVLLIFNYGIQRQD